MHTPAPWKLDSAHSSRVLLINDAKGYAVGEIVETRSPANARLICAAPELLEALLVALPFVEDHELDYRHNVQQSEVYKAGAVAKAVKQIKAAIDKATQ